MDLSILIVQNDDWVLGAAGMKDEDVESEKIVAFPVPPASQLLSQDEYARPVIMSLVIRTGTIPFSNSGKSEFPKPMI